MPADSYDATVARGGAPGAAAATARAVVRDVAPVDRIACAGGAGRRTVGDAPTRVASVDYAVSGVERTAAAQTLAARS